MHATPIVASATVQTTVRQPLLMAGAPATTIAIAGSQYKMKTLHQLDKMSRDLQVVALDSTLPLRYQRYSKTCSAVQSQAKLRSNQGRTFGSESLCFRALIRKISCSSVGAMR